MHRGFWFYTMGQRQGLRLPGGPWYALLVLNSLTAGCKIVFKVIFFLSIFLIEIFLWEAKMTLVQLF